MTQGIEGRDRLLAEQIEYFEHSFRLGDRDPAKIYETLKDEVDTRFHRYPLLNSQLNWLLDVIYRSETLGRSMSLEELLEEVRTRTSEIRKLVRESQQVH